MCRAVYTQPMVKRSVHIDQTAAWAALLVLAMCTHVVRSQTVPTPNPEALSLARALVAKSDAGGQVAMAGLIMPPPAYLAELGITDPRQVQAVSHEAIMPTLGDHQDALTDIQVRSYATLLSTADMKAAVAFYDSPAGKKFVQLKYGHMSANMAGASALIEKLRPEIEAQARVVARAHGWPPG